MNYAKFHFLFCVESMTKETDSDTLVENYKKKKVLEGILTAIDTIEIVFTVWV